jgi:ribonuclease HII
VRRAVAWAAVLVPAPEIDRTGLHVSNLRALRQAVHRLDPVPGYVLTDGFPVAGMPAPSVGVIKGDAVVACIAAASVVAKVTRDRIMVQLAERYPEYGFDRHKGYATPEHSAALRRYGPCPEHRFCYINVRGAMRDNDREFGEFREFGEPGSVHPLPVDELHTAEIA